LDKLAIKLSNSTSTERNLPSKSSSTGDKQRIKVQIIRSLRWLKTKETLGWISICLGTLFPRIWYHRSQRTDRQWRSFILPHFKRAADNLNQSWAHVLVETIGRPLPPGGKDVQDEQFAGWLSELFSIEIPKEWRNLKAGAFLSACIYTNHSASANNPISPLSEFYKTNFIATSIRHSLISQPGLPWPQIGLQAVELVQKFMFEFPACCSESGVAIDHIFAALLPIQFDVVVGLYCRRCKYSWGSDSMSVTHIELAHSPAEVFIFKWTYLTKGSRVLWYFASRLSTSRRRKILH
jgi:hypothetical protein